MVFGDLNLPVLKKTWSTGGKHIEMTIPDVLLRSCQGIHGCQDKEKEIGIMLPRPPRC